MPEQELRTLIMSPHKAGKRTTHTLSGYKGGGVCGLSE
jgi:hypothetical protein